MWWLALGLLGCIGSKDDAETGDTVSAVPTEVTPETTDPDCDEEAPEITTLEVENAGLQNGVASIEIALNIADSDASSLNEMSFQLWVEDDLDGEVDRTAAGAVATNNELQLDTCDPVTTDISLLLPVESMLIPDGNGDYKPMPFNTELELVIVMSDATNLVSDEVYTTFISPYENGLDGDLPTGSTTSGP